MTKRKLLPAVEGRISGCLNCGYTEQRLPMNTRLYNGFGGWWIKKDRKLYFMEAPKKWEERNKGKTLMYIEIRARLQPECDWQAVLDLPMRSAVYQRQGKNKWVLIKTGRGFA
jgi:hypothetical protein